jgi:hypothetical protein
VCGLRESERLSLIFSDGSGDPADVYYYRAPYMWVGTNVYPVLFADTSATYFREDTVSLGWWDGSPQMPVLCTGSAPVSVTQMTVQIVSVT